MNNRQNAARAAQKGNLLFFACVMLSLLAGAFAVTTENKTVLILGLVFCGIFLVLGSVLVFLHSRIAAKYLQAAKAEEAPKAEAAPVEEAPKEEAPAKKTDVDLDDFLGSMFGV